MLHTTRLKILLMMLALTLSATAHAQIKYTFESDPPQTATGEYTSETRFTGHFILDAQYPPNSELVLYSNNPLSPGQILVNNSAWQFSDGIDTFSAATVDEFSVVLVATDENGVPLFLIMSIVQGIDPAVVGEPFVQLVIIAGLNEQLPFHQAFVTRTTCTAVDSGVCTVIDQDNPSELQIFSEVTNGFTTSAVPIPSMSALGLALLALSLAWMGMRAMRHV